ncbi:unnamed protein product [Pylaiella littoralis]
MSLPDDEAGGGDPGRRGGDVGRARSRSKSSSSISSDGGADGSQMGGGAMRQRDDAVTAEQITGPDDKDAVRVSAATGEGLALLLERVDAMLHLGGGGGAGAEGGGGRRFAAKPANRYQYVRVLPGQSQQGYK